LAYKLYTVLCIWHGFKNENIMKKLLELVKNFEKRNNISIAITVMGDGSGSVSEFWDYEELKEYQDIEELTDFLKNTQYLLADDGRCVSPVQTM